MKLVVTNKAHDETLFYKYFRFADDIPPGGNLSYIKSDINPSEIIDEAYYMILVIRYEDPILQRDFAQIFLSRWNTKRINLERVVVSERNEILKHQGLILPLNDENIIKQVWKNE